MILHGDLTIVRLSICSCFEDALSHFLPFLVQKNLANSLKILDNCGIVTCDSRFRHKLGSQGIFIPLVWILLPTDTLHSVPNYASCTSKEEFSASYSKVLLPVNISLAKLKEFYVLFGM
jgi:hypothetical protein